LAYQKGEQFVSHFIFEGRRQPCFCSPIPEASDITVICEAVHWLRCARSERGNSGLKGIENVIDLDPSMSGNGL
jgi:hypothetical protein